jgi:hypothetical protein
MHAMKANSRKFSLILKLLLLDANAHCHILVASHEREEHTVPDICTLLGWSRQVVPKRHKNHQSKLHKIPQERVVTHSHRGGSQKSHVMRGTRWKRGWLGTTADLDVEIRELSPNTGGIQKPSLLARSPVTIETQLSGSSVCMYVYMCVCMYSIWVCMYLCMYVQYACMYVCMCSIYIPTYVCMYVRAVYMYVCMYVQYRSMYVQHVCMYSTYVCLCRIYVCRYVCVYSIYVCMYSMFVYTYICKYVFTYMYIF